MKLRDYAHDAAAFYYMPHGKRPITVSSYDGGKTWLIGEYARCADGKVRQIHWNHYS